MRADRTAAVMGLWLGGLATALAADTVPYHNDRFGFTLDVPLGWASDPPPANGDGATYRSPDRKAFVSAFGRIAQSHFADELKDAFAEHDGEVDTLKRSGKDWVVVSGLRQGTIFYRRGVRSCLGAVWNEVEIEYPQARKKEFDALVAKIAASLTPGIGADTGPCR